ncbi:MAG: dihydropteroate synthase [Parafilimonas sp.]|nr:dihydropteroate synthase [Parafilimonas sp.]
MFTLNCNGRLLVINKPVVMGILNITPDSFYAVSRLQRENEILQIAEKMLNDGATILDVGGQSTRPRSTRISANDEGERVLTVIEILHKNFSGAFISVDTYYATVAEKAVAAGAVIVNDISGGILDKNMLATVGKLNVPYICMHMQGTPESMQQNPTYKNVTREVLDFFIQQTEQCRLHNIKDVIVDVGFGFGKTHAHNFQLLKDLSVFKMLDKPILAGLSRKGTIYKTLNITADDALNGTTVLNTIALLNGANILRVHDVKEAAQAIELIEAYKS